MNKFSSITGIALSYATSILSFLHEYEINLIATASGLAGASLTMALAYKHYQDAQFRKVQIETLKIENKIKKDQYEFDQQQRKGT